MVENKIQNGNDLIQKLIRTISIERGLSENTKIAYAKDLKLMVRWFVKNDIDFVKATEHNFKQLFVSFKNTDLKQSSMNRKRSSMKMFYEFLKEENYINFNPLKSNSTANFKENLGLIYGTVKQGTTPIAGTDVSLIVNWVDSTHNYKNILKTTNSDGEYFYTKADLEGYSTIFTLKVVDSWPNPTFYPTDLTSIAITANAQEYNFNSTLSIHENIKNEGLQIFPNPVSDIVYIDGSSSQLKIVVFDILGKQVLNKSNTNTINVSLLSKGVYFIKVSDGINSSTKKFIKN